MTEKWAVLQRDEALQRERQKRGRNIVSVLCVEV